MELYLAVDVKGKCDKVKLTMIPILNEQIYDRKPNHIFI